MAATAYVQTIFGLNPLVPGAGPVPTGGKAIVYGTAVVSANTIELPVPFGGSKVDFIVGGATGVTTGTNAWITVISDGTISSGAVTVATKSASTTDTIWVLAIGDMNEA